MADSHNTGRGQPCVILSAGASTYGDGGVQLRMHAFCLALVVAVLYLTTRHPEYGLLRYENGAAAHPACQSAAA